MLDFEVGLCGLCLFGTQALPRSFILESIRGFVFYYVWRLLRHHHGTDVECIKLSLYDHSAHYDLGSSSTAQGESVIIPLVGDATHGIVQRQPASTTLTTLLTTSRLQRCDGQTPNLNHLPLCQWTALCVAGGEGVVAVAVVYSVVFL